MFFSVILLCFPATSEAQEFPTYCKQNSTRTDFNGYHCDASKLKVGKYYWLNDMGPGSSTAREAYLWRSSISTIFTEEGSYLYLQPLPGECEVGQLSFSTYSAGRFGGFQAFPCIFATYYSGGRQPNDTAPAWASAAATCPAGWLVGAMDRNGSRGMPGVCYLPLQQKSIGQPESCAKEPTCGNPISIGSGNKYQREVDYANGALTVDRHYNSMGSAAEINIGNKWRFGFDRSVRVSRINNVATGWVDVQRPDGKLYSFKQNAGAFLVDSDVSDRLTQLRDVNGNAIGWQIVASRSQETERYALDGKLNSVTTLGGETTFFTYTGDKLTTITDQYGRKITLQYDSLGRVSGFIDPSGAAYSYEYVAEASNLIDLAAANLVQVNYPDGKSKKYQYDVGVDTQATNFSSALTGIIDEKGNNFAKFVYGTASQAKLAVSTERFGGVEKYSIALSGGATNILDVTDPLGTVRKHWFAQVQGVWRLSDLDQPCGTPGCSGTVRSTQTYDANANITSRTHFSNIKTCYAYDLTRNLETTRVEGLASSASCPTALSATTQTPPARKTTTTWHPTYRLPATITEPVAGGSKVTTNTYDTSGNLTQRQVTTPSGSRTWNWTYDQYGRVLTATDPLGRVSTNTYYPNTEAQNVSIPNSRGMLASATNPLGHTVTITAYNPHGQPLSITDANGLATSMTYDARQRMTSRTVGNETTTYQYDGVGQLTKVTLPDASYLTYTYDGAHRLTQIQDGLNNKITYTLDNIGNRTAEYVTDASGALARTRSRVYDALNRLQKDIGGATPATQVTQYTYDNNGNQTGMTVSVRPTPLYRRYS
jgi:YD repeat-containing protein